MIISNDLSESVKQGLISTLRHNAAIERRLCRDATRGFDCYYYMLRQSCAETLDIALDVHRYQNH